MQAIDGDLPYDPKSLYWLGPKNIEYSIKEGQSGPKTYYYRDDFPGFFCCPTFWTF